jgi:hypothetical protein
LGYADKPEPRRLRRAAIQLGRTLDALMVLALQCGDPATAAHATAELQQLVDDIASEVRVLARIQEMLNDAGRLLGHARKNIALVVLRTDRLGRDVAEAASLERTHPPARSDHVIADGGNVAESNRSARATKLADLDRELANANGRLARAAELLLDPNRPDSEANWSFSAVPACTAWSPAT